MARRTSPTRKVVPAPPPGAFDREQQYRARREAVLREASAQFNRKGFPGTSLDAVAARLKITKPALYHYVKNKRELLFAVYQRALDNAVRCAAEAASGAKTSGLEKLRRYTRLQIESFGSPEAPFATLDALPSLLPARRAAILARSNAHDERVRGFVRKGLADGSIAPCDPKLTELAILGALNWMPKWFSLEGPRTAAEIAGAFVHLFVSGLEPR